MFGMAEIVVFVNFKECQIENTDTRQEFKSWSDALKWIKNLDKRFVLDILICNKSKLIR